jgi:hypothetical protein
MRKIRVMTQVVAIGALLAYSASEAAAQACAGFPAAQGQFSLGARWSSSVGVLTDGEGTALGVEGSLNRFGRAAVFGVLNLITPDDDGDQHAAVGVGAAYDITDMIPALPTWLNVCPVASVTYTQIDGNARFGIPLGIGFGASIGVPEGPFTLMPYAIPTFRLVRFGLDEINWENNFGIGFGALARFDMFYVGVEFDRMFVDDADFDIALRGGIRFPR